MKQKKKFDFSRTILWIGNFFAAKHGGMNASKPISGDLEDRGWGKITISNYKNRLLRLVEIISTIICRRNDYALASLEIYSGWAFIWAEISVLLLKILGKKTVISLRGGKLIEFAKKWPYRVRLVLNAASVVTTPSLYIKDNLSVFHDTIVYLPNGLDVNRYKFRLRNAVDPKLVWLRAFHEIYNPSLAIEAVELLRREFPSINILMVGPNKGDGSLEKVLRKVNKYKLNNNVQIIKGVKKSEVPDILSSGEIFINTTRYESFGVSVMEAAASGLPIVSTNVGELPYLWEDKQNALLVNPVPSEMAEAIAQILRDKKLAENLSINAREKALEYSWKKTIDRWENVIVGLLP